MTPRLALGGRRSGRVPASLGHRRRGRSSRSRSGDHHIRVPLPGILLARHRHYRMGASGCTPTRHRPCPSLDRGRLSMDRYLPGPATRTLPAPTRSRTTCPSSTLPNLSPRPDRRHLTPPRHRPLARPPAPHHPMTPPAPRHSTLTPHLGRAPPSVTAPRRHTTSHPSNLAISPRRDTRPSRRRIPSRTTGPCRPTTRSSCTSRPTSTSAASVSPACPPRRPLRVRPRTMRTAQ